MSLNEPIPLLTIAIPTVNRLALFKKALASALAQTVRVEIIVSDNGSSDGTEVYLPSLDLPDNVRRFRHSPTMPVQHHGAFLRSQIRTEWVVFLSDDDYLEPEFAARIVALIEERPDAALVYTGCDQYFGDVAVPAIVGPRFESAQDFLFNFLVGERQIAMCATAFRSSVMRAVGPQPDDILIGDMYFWTNILLDGGVVGCDDATLSHYFFYRPRATSETSRTNVVAWARESRDLAARMSAGILSDPGNGYREDEVARVARRFVALTVANQFAWNALRGVGRLQLARGFLQLSSIIFSNIHALVRVGGVMVFPRKLLEARVLAHARRQARLAGRAS